MLPPAVSELVVPTVIAPVCATPPPAVEVRLEPTLVTPKLVRSEEHTSELQSQAKLVFRPLATEIRSPEPVAVIDALRSFASASVMFAPEAATAPTISTLSLHDALPISAVSELVVPTVIAPVCATPPPAVEVRLEPTLVTPKLV